MASPPKCYRDMTSPELADWALNVNGTGWRLGVLEYALAQRLKDELRKFRIGKPHIHKMKTLWQAGAIGELWVCKGPAGICVYGPTPTIVFSRYKEVMSRDVYRTIKARSS